MAKEAHIPRLGLCTWHSPMYWSKSGTLFFISGKISRKIEQNFGTRNRIDITEMQQLLKKYDSDIIAENYFLFCFSNLEGFGSPIIA